MTRIVRLSTVSVSTPFATACSFIQGEDRAGEHEAQVDNAAKP